MKNSISFLIVVCISIMLLIVGIFFYRSDTIPNADEIRKKSATQNPSYIGIVNQAFTKFEDSSKLDQQVTSVLFEYQDDCCKNAVILRADNVLHLLSTNNAQEVNRMSSEKQKSMSSALLAHIKATQSTLPFEPVKRIGRFKINSEITPKLFIKNSDDQLFRLVLDSDNMNLPACMDIARKINELLLETTGYHPTISGFENYPLNLNPDEN